MIMRNRMHSGEPPSSSLDVSPAATVGLSATVKLGAVPDVMFSVFELPVSPSPPGPRAAASARGVQREAQRAGPVLPNVSVWAATMV